MHAPRNPRYQVDGRRVTPEALALADRRTFLRRAGMGLAGGLLAAAAPRGWAAAPAESGFTLPPRPSDKLYPPKPSAAFGPLPDRKLTPPDVAGRYNNYYEFTTDKAGVDRLSAKLTIDPWTIKVGGLVEKPFEIGFEDLAAKFPLEERIYRMRCVEAWSMVVPWDGFPLRSLIDFCKPLASARYVRFVSFLQPKEAPGQNASDSNWPYYEGLRLDEARNELALIVTGIYGKPLPKQHGAPVRVVVPWKYGYKSPKAIVGIEFTDRQPATFWNDLAPDEYPFLSNVDPAVPHPRWSQATERDIGADDERIPTLPYNGYAAQVAALYPKS